MDKSTDDAIRSILLNARTIAIVGASANPERPSHSVMDFLQRRGYRVRPVNPGLAGQELLGVRVAARLSEIDEPIDIVDVFRQSSAVPEIVDESLGLTPPPGTIWMQIGVRNDSAAEKARSAGLAVIQDRCPKIEFARLSLPSRVC